MTLFCLFILGLLVGSFLNVLADRLPQGQDIFFDRSRCDWCRKTLRPFELVPLLSYVIQNGKCRRCHHILSVQYPLVELVTAGIFVSVALSYQGITMLPYEYVFSLIGSLFISCSLLVIFLSDLKYQIIPDCMLVVGLLGVLVLRFLAVRGEQSAVSYLLSACGAGGFFYLLYLVTKRRGLGFGDVKLGLLLGFFLGYPKIVIGLYAGFLTGALTGVILILARLKKLKSKIALGPFLIWGTIVSCFWGQQIINWWYKLF